MPQICAKHQRYYRLIGDTMQCLDCNPPACPSCARLEAERDEARKERDALRQERSHQEVERLTGVVSRLTAQLQEAQQEIAIHKLAVPLGAMSEPQTDQRFILAEYCGGPFYKGWHLYERERPDGSLNHDGCGWLRRGAQALYDLQRLMPSLPAPENETAYPTLAEIRWHGRLVEAFVAQFPYGLAVAMDGRHYMSVSPLPAPRATRSGE